MAVDLEAIARRGRCDASSLKLALPLLEQGYEAPFLARYRRDELGGLDEATLWSLKIAVEAEQELADFREDLLQNWQSTPLVDPAIGEAIRKSGSNRTLQRLGKRLRQETAAGVDSDANRLAVRMLNPEKGDSSDPAAVAEAMESVSDTASAVEGLAAAIPARLAGDPRVISAAVRWLSRNAKIHISNVHDPHINAGDDDEPHDGELHDGELHDGESSDSAQASGDADHENSVVAETAATENHGDQIAAGEHVASETTDQDAASPSVAESTESVQLNEDGASDEVTGADVPAEPVGEAETEIAETDSTVNSDEGSLSESSSSVASGEDAGDRSSEDVVADAPAAAESDSAAAAESIPEELPGFTKEPGEKTGKKKKEKAAPKKQKKISPRQRRRRWLVSVLKPLEGKRLPATKLSAFQVVMLGRALRSQVAVCAFEYDAAKLVGEIKRSVIGLNKGIEAILGDVVMQHEADIREAAEAAWWDELHERASARLVTVVADHLRRQVNRGPVDAKVVMSIDAVGPKTAATAIVSADGRVLHGEDLPCQLSGNVRGQTVAKMGELIHHYHVDLVVVSNGPARRACLIALGDLIAQSPDQSVRWTVADRTGADSYSSSDVANSEMRSTPRRFRAAAWVAFSVLHPAQAYAKVDPMRLRLASFQSELSDEALEISLGHIMASGASRGGVDANAAPLGWLRQLPGMSNEVAQALVARREQKLFSSRQELLTLEGWKTAVETRQAMAFLRVFESDEVLDGTLIHPDDYALAKKLATALEIELPPPAPPGYETPSYEKQTAAELKLIDATTPKQPAPVEDFDHAGEKAGEFKIDDDVAETETADPVGGDAGASEPDPAEGDAGQSESVATESVASDETTPESSTNEIVAESDESNESPDAEASADEELNADVSSDADASSAEAAPSTSESPAYEPIKRPLPERAKIDKCIKEWQVGRHRVNQLVGWLCDPFGETAISNDPPGVLNTMPTLKTLKPGDQVVGVVVGVMSFGVFVELAPDCSGLIHVSRLSDGYVEDLNEAIQVGDVVTAWVTGIDEKRRRVGLSALSPAQEERLEKERQSRETPAARGGFRRDSQPGRGRSGQGQGGQRQGGQRQGGQPGRAGAGQGQAGAGQSASGGHSAGGDQGQSGRGGGQGRGGQGRGGQGQGRGGQGRGGQGGRAGQAGRGGRKPRQPESYRVVAKPEAKPISDAMQKGVEPLRSFGDLLQFYSKAEEPAAKKEPEKKQDAPAEVSSSSAPAEPSSVQPPTVQPPTVQPAAESSPVSAGQPAAAESSSSGNAGDSSQTGAENSTGAVE
ncbi:MAG: S1 RNA-binding domain-containing protein [Planctomycetales bacterium]|nr:S1 RNA-binding domain-containing protein [Planctomycetales bacterium]